MVITADVVGELVVLDGQDAQNVLYITGGTVQLIGLDITNGATSGYVRRIFCSSICMCT